MITLCEVSKSFGGKTLFTQASLQVNPTDRIGIVGPNGAGKTTLFSLLLTEQSPDDGRIIVEKKITIGYLPQESAPAGYETVLELATAISPEFTELRKKLRESSPEGGSGALQLAEFQSRYEALGGYDLEPRAKKILSGLGFRQADFDRPVKELSGGWIMRTHLARLLVQSPDLLMLDEPTNHLDLDALLWFQHYLRNYSGALMLISHDRAFLNFLALSIVEIRQGRLCQYRGNYDDYLVQREAQAKQIEAAYKNQQREIAHLMEFVERFRAKNTKATQAQSKLKQIERMEKIEAPESEAPSFHFSFPQPARSGQKVLALNQVCHAYGNNVVYQDLNFEVQRGQRVVLVGPNGAGKSTLLKLLAGAIPLQSGSRELGHNVKSGYYSQYRLDVLHPEWTALEEAYDSPQPLTETLARTVLGSFGFRGDDVFKKVSVLSGGEKSRLALIKLLLDPPNLLLMDEPTTHLDMAGIEALIAAMKEFTGTMVFISHDVYFIQSLANQVVHVQSGSLTVYPGSYDYYRDRIAEQEALRERQNREAAPAEENRSTDLIRQQRRQRAELQDARARILREQKKIVMSLEKEIEILEKRQSSITAELQETSTYQIAGRVAELNREFAANQKQLSTLNHQWEASATKLLEIESAELDTFEPYI